MTFGEDWGWGASKEESRNIFEAFIEAGGNFIDTANSYTGGTSETFLGEYIASQRDRFVVATKYTHFNRLGDVNAGGNHRKSLVQAVEASLKRLRTDYIDLLWVHAWDFLTPVEEVLRALDDLVRAGKILYTGISDTPAWIVSQANTMAVLQGWTAFIGLQLEYSLIQRTAERELLPMARALDVGVTAWGSLGAGLLTGKYNRSTAPADQSEPPRIEAARDLYGALLNERNLTIAREVQRVANEAGQPPAAVALNWVRQHDGSPIPIVGARTAGQLAENMRCLAFRLTNEQVARLNQVSQIERGFPHDFLDSDAVRYLTYSGAYEAIDFSG